MYQVQRPSQSQWVPLRGCRYHVRHWGTLTPQATPLVLAHGWMDVAASYQFMVDAFSEDFVSQRPIIAMDWRGYGLTESPLTDCYCGAQHGWQWGDEVRRRTTASHPKIGQP